MQGPLAWPLRLLGWRSPAADTWTLGAGVPGPRPPLTGLWPARPWGAGPGLLRGAGAARDPRRWTSGCPGGGPRGRSGGAGLARLLGLWARSPGASRCGALVGPDVPRLRRAGLRGGPAVAARGGGEAWQRGSALPAAAATPGDNSRLHPAAARRSEAQKLLGLAYPERGRLAAAVGFLAMSSVITMSAPFFLGKIIDVIYTNPTVDSSHNLTHLCLVLSGVFLCGAAANAVRVYLMQTSVFCLTWSGHFCFECGASNIHPCCDLRTLSTETNQTYAGFPGTSHSAEERIGNIRTVRAFGKEMIEIEKYASKMDHVMQLARKEAFARAFFFGATGLSGNLIVLSVLYKGGLLMGSAQMTVGELSSFLLYAFWVGVSIGGLSSFYSELMKGLGAGGRLWELLEREPELPFNEGVVLNQESFQGTLEFRNVHFSYPARPEVPIFQDFSLSIPSASVTALVGPSGSGKSTVVSLLLRLYDPVSGTISLDGHDIRQLNPVWLRSKIGTVSQEPILFSCSIGENIAYGADDPSSVTAEQIERVADVANAGAFIRDFPQGFNTVVGEKGVLLSGGQKQRIAIARALLKNPKILLLDEATSALDAENEHLVQEALDRLMAGRTVLIIAHRLSTIKNANTVAVLDQGKITECGKHEELLAKPDGIYRKLMNKQRLVPA
ncbi:ATP-binding cassette sub-family B member 10, mitochondrial isoform X2 [Lontra canadensis]|uniref:ATP-binding cassette sub-family B member 10, mitochondrial isoform X2 n=1 Tax=Lontra canadensis TaxID=76717 RepID=UPI0013F2BA6F|nr:ATP-binding cassette sub-family B member 10, mitochondrial isoform X2 [Lontra canadensis]